MRLLKKSKPIITILVILLTGFSTIALGADISLREALEHGLANNSEIRSARSDIDQLKRELASSKAGEKWSADLGAGYDYTTRYENPKSEGDYLSLSLSKHYPSGLEIDPQFSLSLEDQKTSTTLKVTQPLLPSLPTAAAQEQYKTEQSLVRAAGSLQQKQAEKVLAWLESYLKIQRLVDRREIDVKGVKQAEDNLDEVQQKEKLQEAGKDQLLSARLGLENARYELQSVDNQLEEARADLAVELGFEDTQDLMITDSANLVDQLRDKADKLAEKLLSQPDLMAGVEENNPQLQASRNQLKQLKQELEWLQKEGRTSLNMNGSYSPDDDNLILGLSLNYQLADGGQYQLSLEGKKTVIDNQQADYQDLYQQLQLQLKQQINTINLDQLSLKRQKLDLEKSQYELDVASQQLEMGLIDYLEYQDYWTTAADAQIKLASLEDQLFLTELELIHFVSGEDILGG